MPSIKSIILRRVLKTIKPAIGKSRIALARSFQDKQGELAAMSVAKKVGFDFFDINGFNACYAYPKTLSSKEHIILHLHGGGYVAGNIKYAKGFAGMLAKETGKRVLSIAYRLAPEHAFPAALEDALAAYEYLLNEGYSPHNISMVGESAGGGLIYCLCLLLKQKKLPLPAALTAISPWADLTLSGSSYKQNAKKDPTLSENLLLSCANAYAPGQKDNPLVSPVFGDLGLLPPSLIIAGGDEILLDDARMLAKRLSECGSKCRLMVEEGLWHVYVLYKVPEAKIALKLIAGFINNAE